MRNKHDKNLLNPATAVSSYLDTLLQMEDQPDEQPATVTLETQPQTVLYMPVIESDLAALDKLARDERVAAPEDRDEPPAQPAAPVIDEAAGVRVEVSAPRPKPAGEARDRYDFPMQCLMFGVAGVDFSMPLIDMGSVIPGQQTLTRLPGGPAWFLGLLKHRERNIRVVDSASLLRLERQHPVDGQHILVFGESNWAMTCDQLGQVVRLAEDDIQWKPATGKSLSLGTIRSSLALLLDPVKLVAYLNQKNLPGDEAGPAE